MEVVFMSLPESFKINEPVTDLNIRSAYMFASKDSRVVQLNMGFDLDKEGEDSKCELLNFHTELLSALETNGVQAINHDSGYTLEVLFDNFLQLKKSNRSIGEETILCIQYIASWDLSVEDGVVEEFPALQVTFNSNSNPINGPVIGKTDFSIIFPLVDRIEIDTDYDDSDDDDDESEHE